MTAVRVVERMKLDLLAEGLTLTPAARDWLDQANESRSLTSADYASTSGLILCLEDDVWVNAPVAEFNQNFVTGPRHTLDVHDGALRVSTAEHTVPARFWLQPAYHGRTNAQGEPYNSYVFTHTDRVRVSPIEGCAFTCTFCDLPYEFRYRRKSVEGLLDATRVALDDPVQPARHVLISGGTPRPADYGYVREVYEAVITETGVPVDIMMVPLVEVLDLDHLARLGLGEVSINLEVWSDEVARRVMPRKHKQGRDYYLDFLSHAADVLGGQNVRSMLMLGIEPLESTLEGVAAIAERGCVPVLSPFRPDPSTPLRDWPVPDAALLATAYDEALRIAHSRGVRLGPPCVPCSHNTLTFASTGSGDADRYHDGVPNLV